MSESIPKTEDELIEGEDYYSSMYDLLGTEDTTFNITTVKEKVKGLIDGGYIQNVDNIALFNINLYRKNGVICWSLSYSSSSCSSSFSSSIIITIFSSLLFFFLFFFNNIYDLISS